LSVRASAFVNAAFSVDERGRISIGAGAVAVGDIGLCMLTAQADSAAATNRTAIARQFSAPRSASKLMPAVRSM
jgi:hypothetical protein